MNRITRILSMLLAAQLVLVAIMFWPESSRTDSESNTALMSFDSAGITRIVVSDKETSLVLSRLSQGWALPEYHKLPADPDKIASALQTLPRLSRGWPMAQTQGARQRFEVAEDNYQRKLQFASDTDTFSTVYLGTSPGFRKVHARLDGEDAIYAVEFNTFDLPVTESGWLDKTLLQLSEVNAVQGLDYQLNRNGDDWRMAAGETPVQATVDGLINGLQSLQVNGSVDIAIAAILRDTEAPPTLTVGSGDKTYEYRLFEIKDAYYLKRSDIDIYFSVSALDYDRLNDVNAAVLLPQEEPAAREPAAVEDSGNGKPAAVEAPASAEPDEVENTGIEQTTGTSAPV
ncbi:MAG: DUF4340 domain-containing protein [Gammaproteobacteria bacterium]|nr:DUF4340 domain-containing protein [Gammaproteobacteria bacterium]